MKLTRDEIQEYVKNRKVKIVNYIIDNKTNTRETANNLKLSISIVRNDLYSFKQVNRKLWERLVK